MEILVPVPAIEPVYGYEGNPKRPYQKTLGWVGGGVIGVFAAIAAGVWRFTDPSARNAELNPSVPGRMESFTPPRHGPQRNQLLVTSHVFHDSGFERRWQTLIRTA
jgi:hypothetical protein